MNLRKGITWAAATVAASVAMTGVASAATVNSHNADGNPARYAPYMHTQTVEDCVEQSALMAMSALAGKWIASHAGIDTEAYRLGLTGPTFDGSTFDAGNVALFKHYGFKATAPKATSKATLMADLAKGDAVQVTAYAADLWAGVPVPGHSDWVWVDSNTVPSPDHAVLVEAINKATGAVTVGDTGLGITYTIPWGQFSKAWGVGDYQAIVVSRG